MGSGGIAPFLTLALDLESRQFHAAAALVLVKEPLWRLNRTLSGRRCWYGRLPLPGINHDLSIVRPLPLILLWGQDIYPPAYVYCHKNADLCLHVSEGG